MSLAVVCRTGLKNTEASKKCLLFPLYPVFSCSHHTSATVRHSLYSIPPVLTKRILTKLEWNSHAVMCVLDPTFINFNDINARLRYHLKCFFCMKDGLVRTLTEHSPSRHWFSIQPERHLGENDCHDAREVRLDDKVADFPLQMKMSRHHCVFTCGDENQGHFKAPPLQLLLLLPFIISHWSTFNYLIHLINAHIYTVISAQLTWIHFARLQPTAVHECYVHWDYIQLLICITSYRRSLF